MRLLAVAVAVVAGVLFAGLAARGLAEKQPRRSGTNSVFPSSVVAELQRGQHLCQKTIVPADTRVIEIPFAREAFPRAMTLVVRDESKKIVATARPTEVRARATRFAFPRTIDHDVGGDVCLVQGRGPAARFLGDKEKPGLTVNELIVSGAISMAYYRAGRERLISMVPVIAQRIGRTRGRLDGSWRAITVVVLLVASIALAAWGMLGLLRGRGRRIALIVALVAGLNSLAWGLLVPSIQIPDEHFHLSYVQDLAVHHRPPAAYVDELSQELNVIVGGAAVGDINFNPVGRGHWSPDADQKLDRELAAKPTTDNKGASINLRDYPPAYYATLLPAYWIVHAAGGSTLDALTFMRAQGALLAIVTALALLALLRELFPTRPLLTGGVALICAFQPVFTWISGGVNPDGMLIALGAVLFWLFARAFNRGLDVRLAVAIGLVLALSGLTKISALGFLPGTVLGIGLLLWRRAPAGRLRPALAAALAAGLPVLVYTVVNRVVWGRSIIPAGIGAAARGNTGHSAEQASSFITYLWQYVLPPIGSMTDFFRVGWTPKDFWTPLFVGRFGWFDYQFPNAVNSVAFVLYAVVAIAALVALARRLPRKWIIWVIFAGLTAGLVVAIARAGYPLRAGGNYLFEQTRYFLPLIALYAVSLGLAFSLLRGRALAVVTSVLVGVSSVHLVAAFVLTVRRYYL